MLAGAAPPSFGGQGFFSSALCLPVPQIVVSKHETTLVDSSEVFLCRKSGRKVAVSNFENLG
jgi:hypothetical protein